MNTQLTFMLKKFKNISVNYNQSNFNLFENKSSYWSAQFFSVFVICHHIVSESTGTH